MSATKSTESLPVISQTPAGPVTNIVTEVVTNYSPSPAIAATQAKIDAGIQAFAPVLSAAVPVTAPAASLAQPITDGVFGLIAAVSGLVAVYKNKQASQHQAAAQALASALVTNPGMSALAQTNAAANGSTQLVAQHLADAAKPV